MQRPTTKPELLATIQSDYQALLDQVQRFLPAEQQAPGVNGDWALKDLLTHLMAWEELFLGWYHAGARGEIPVMPAPGHTWGWKSLDALNQRLFLQHKELSPAAAAQAFATSHAEVVALIESLSEAELFTSGHYGWLGKAPLEALIRANTYNHYQWATKLIRQWAKAQTKTLGQ